MSHGTESRYAPKVVPSLSAKPSGQNSVRTRYYLNLTSGGTGSEINSAVTTETALLADLDGAIGYLFQPAKAGETWDEANAHATYTTQISSSSLHGGFLRVVFAFDIGTDLTDWVLITNYPKDGFTFSDITWWTCQICGLPFRKWELIRHPIEGKFVCKADYNAPDQKTLTAYNDYRGAAILHAAEDYTAKGEWP